MIVRSYGDEEWTPTDWSSEDIWRSQVNPTPSPLVQPTTPSTTWPTNYVEVPTGYQPTTAPATAEEDSSGVWNTLISAFKTIGASRQPTAPVVVAQSPSVPEWVWLAVPLGAGALVLTLAIASGGRRKQLSGYRRRTNRRR